MNITSSEATDIAAEGVKKTTNFSEPTAILMAEKIFCFSLRSLLLDGIVRVFEKEYFIRREYKKRSVQYHARVKHKKSLSDPDTIDRTAVYFKIAIIKYSGH